MRRSTVPAGEERRDLSVAVARPEVRATAGGPDRFAGHAAVFNARTAIGNPLTWGFHEEVAPGAFSKTLAESDARMLIDHDSFYVVARASAGTLDLRQDRVGLAVDAVLDDDLSYVRDLKANLRNGNITGMSFGFQVVKDDWGVEQVETNDGAAEVEVRTIREVKLIEVSAVTFPAYAQTDAGLRSAVLALRSRGDVDAIARRAGYRPELAALLEEYDPRSGATVIDLGTRAAKAGAKADCDEPLEEAYPGYDDGDDTAEAAETNAAKPAAEKPDDDPFADADPAVDPDVEDDEAGKDDDADDAPAKTVKRKAPPFPPKKDDKNPTADDDPDNDGDDDSGDGPDPDDDGGKPPFGKKPADKTSKKRNADEPGETTRGDAPGDDESEPADATRDQFAPSEAALRAARMRVLATRYGLPTA